MHPLYPVIQVLVVLTFGVSVSLPLTLGLNYLGTFEARCHQNIDEYFAFYHTRRMFTVYMCLETILTRLWTLKETHKVMALADGKPLWYWARFDRMKFNAVAFCTTLVLDVGALLWVMRAPSACDPGKRAAEELATISAMCRHTLDVGSGVRVLHFVNIGLGVASLSAPWCGGGSSNRTPPRARRRFS